ncbi:MAG: hypothetical protein FJZ63_03850 [Chlamydiae bacterium]|nr:hypothetical protein [Chlamydiota bacterium]
MCLFCWNADERKNIVLSEDCDGKLTPFMTFEELKTKIIEKWQHTKQTSHTVYKDAIIDPPSTELEWISTLGNNKIPFKVRLI